MRSHGLSRESSPYVEWDCEGTGSKLQRVPRALRFGLQLVVDQMLQTLKSCSVCRAPYAVELYYFHNGAVPPLQGDRLVSLVVKVSASKAGRGGGGGGGRTPLYVSSYTTFTFTRTWSIHSRMTA